MAGETATNSLIVTKLHRPPVTYDHLHRQGLLDRLNQHRYHPMALIAAPAGYGKSTLVSCWLEAYELPSAWLSLANMTITYGNSSPIDCYSDCRLYGRYRRIILFHHLIWYVYKRYRRRTRLDRICNLFLKNWNPIGAMVGALTFGIAEALEIYMQSSGGVMLPNELFIAIPCILTIVLTISRKKFNVPTKLGTPYIKEH